MTKLPDNYTQKGQALLIVLLGMAVALTMILSVVSRSVTDIQLSTRDEESQRAFSAAEAGVEKAFLTGNNETDIVTTGVQYSAQVTEVSEGENVYLSPSTFLSGESETLWFVAHDSEGNMVCGGGQCVTGAGPLNICWGNNGTNANTSQTPALEVMIYYDNIPGQSLLPTPNYSNVRISKAVFDPYADRRNNQNSFSTASTGCSIASFSDFAFTTNSISLTNETYGIPLTCLGTEGCLLFAKLKLIYNTATRHPIVIRFANDTLPGQSILVESRGSVGNEAQSVIEATKSYREVPTIFESAIFSMGTGANLNKTN